METEEWQAALRHTRSNMDSIEGREVAIRRNLAQIRQRQGNSEVREATLRRNLAQLRQRQGRLERERDSFLPMTRRLESEPRMTRSPTPPADRDDSTHTIVLNPGEPLRLIRSPEPMHASSRPHSRDGTVSRRNALPTPPLERSASGDLDERMVEASARRMPTHPLSNSWRAESPVGGLGDRDRSPTPVDGWEIMRTTITPDETLPSAESSFTSAAFRQSFNTSSGSTEVTEPDVGPSNNRPDPDSDSDGPSYLDPEDFSCMEDDDTNGAAYANDVFMHERRSSAGRQRILRHEQARRVEGNRFALGAEPAQVDIGFRLIDEALQSAEGRERIYLVRTSGGEPARPHRSTDAPSQVSRDTQDRRHRLRQEYSQLNAARPRPDHARPASGEDLEDVSNEARRQVHDYFRRLEPDGPASPPPQYELSTANPNIPVIISRDAPQAHPVSPPSNRSEREVSDALLSGDVQDLDSMRRVVERLAARDDVPEEWWMAMGLNLSRTRPRDRSPERRARENLHTILEGRVERTNPRL